MTSKQPDPDSDGLKVDFQKLDFSGVVDDDKAVYTASIKNREAAATVTVTVAAQLYKTEALKEFLSQIKAGLRPTEPNSKEDTADDRDPVPALNLAKEIGMEAVGAGATVVVKTPVPEEEDPQAAEFRSAPGPQPVRVSVLAGKELRLNATGGVTRTATAAARAGSGTLRSQLALNPHQNLVVGGGNRSVRGKAVWVRATSQRTVVDITFN